MYDEDDFLLACLALKIIRRKKKFTKRRFWVRPSLTRRKDYSGTDLMNDLKKDDVGLPTIGVSSIRSSFVNFVRMTSSDFEELLCLIGPKIAKQNTNYRDAIPVSERLALTLRFLGTGDSYVSLGYLLKTSKQSIRIIVPEVCEAITEALGDYLKVPNTKEDWLQIAKQFDMKWNVPNCIGAIDGKHVALQSPIHSGTEFYNYKSFFSIVMLVAVDGNYKITYANVGTQGRISDGGVFNKCLLNKQLEENGLDLPPPVPLPERNSPVPFVLLADDAFPLTEHIMKPYAGIHNKGSKERISNYRFSRGRRIVENVFGIIASVFRIFRKPMLVQETTATTVTLTCLHLHNFLRRNSRARNYYNPLGTYDTEDPDSGTIIPGAWRREEPSVGLVPWARVPRRSARVPKEIRDEFCDYFLKEGKVDWQDKYS